MASNRENFPAESIQSASDHEKIRAIETYLSYSGRWEIRGEKIFVDVVVSLLPNMTNKEHYRYFQISGDSLSFQTPVFKQREHESYFELSWQRV